MKEENAEKVSWENELLRRVSQLGVEEDEEMKLKRVGFEFILVTDE
jgi:hypothetical protein